MANDLVIRIRTEGQQAAGQGLKEPANALRELSAGGQQATQVLGQLGSAGQIAGAALGGGAMMAGIMAGKFALDQLKDAAVAVEQQLQKMNQGGSLTSLSALYGPGAARQAAIQGAQFGLGADVSVQTRLQLANTLGAGARTGAATEEVYRLGSLGFSTDQAGTFIGGLMASNRNLSSAGAGNLFLAAQTRIGPQGAEMLPQIVGAAGEFGYSPGEALALTELMTRSGVSPAAALATIQNLGGASPDVAKLLRRAGVAEGMGLGETLRTLQGANLSGEARRLIYGRGIRGMSSVMANMGEFDEAAAAYSAAASGGTSQAAATFQRLYESDSDFRRDFDRRLVESRAAAADIGGSTYAAEFARAGKFYMRHPLDSLQIMMGGSEEMDYMNGAEAAADLNRRGANGAAALRDGAYEAARESDRRNGM